MPRIATVETCLARVPLDTPVSFSTRLVTVREYCLVRITDTDGHVGIGYCYAVNSAGILLTTAVTDLLAPRLIGEDSHAVEHLWQSMYQDALLQGRAGGVMRALSAVDTALWTLNAAAAGLPLYRFLGAHQLESVPAYASGGYYRPDKSLDELADEVRGFVRLGYDAIKIKIGKLPPRQDAERVAVVREAIGPDIHLMLDANNAWTDVPAACRHLCLVEEYNPFWIEEPFSPDEIDMHAELARRTAIPVATGEVEAGRWRFKELLDKRAADFLQTDATVCGGISEWRRIVATAASYGIQVAPHAWHDIHVHLVAHMPNCNYVEFMPGSDIVNFRDLIDRQLTLENGRLLLPQTPGIGFDFDAQAIDRYAVRRTPGAGPWTLVEGTAKAA